MANQLVVIGNRVVAHGTDCFADIGGGVVCLTDDKIYAGASLVECSTDCPADIDSVGYEYHSGIFVPCAPYGQGNGNGYFMEVGENCATPRSSGLPIKDINWGKIASVSWGYNNIQYADVTYPKTLPVSTSTLRGYSMLRYKIKAGSYFHFSHISDSGMSTNKLWDLLSVDSIVLYRLTATASGNYYAASTRDETLRFNTDVVFPFYLVNSSTRGYRVGDYADYTGIAHGASVTETIWRAPDGTAIDPLTLSVKLPRRSTVDLYSTVVAEIVLEGRK